jgi:hypothetical protein
MSNTETDNSAEAPQVNLGLQDLLTSAQLIALGTQRGAWRAEELTTVGGLYDRLMAFLQASGALTRTDDAPAAEEAAPEPKESKNAKTRRKA